MTGFALTKIATQLAFPLSISLALSLVGLVLLARGRARRAAVFLTAGFALLWIAAMPVVGFTLNQSLERRYPAIAPEQAQTASAIVLLGGSVAPAVPPLDWMDLNESVDRIVHASRLHRAGKAPVIIATGGGGPRPFAAQKPSEATADLLVEWGIPRDAILVERESRNTYENATMTKQLLDAHGLDGPILLVTSAAHMWRSMLLFETAGMTPIPAATDFTGASIDYSRLLTWLPSTGSLRATDGAIKEYLGVFVDRLRGRIRGGG